MEARAQGGAANPEVRHVDGNVPGGSQRRGGAVLPNIVHANRVVVIGRQQLLHGDQQPPRDHRREHALHTRTGPRLGGPRRQPRGRRHAGTPPAARDQWLVLPAAEHACTRNAGPCRPRRRVQRIAHSLADGSDVPHRHDHHPEGHGPRAAVLPPTKAEQRECVHQLHHGHTLGACLASLEHPRRVWRGHAVARASAWPHVALTSSLTLVVPVWAPRLGSRCRRPAVLPTASTCGAVP
mmetsp:Transcript_27215/g.84333  ORF Transcript_27215/g.84333 Transcript_27215/m.84333 type:complete len:238 (-) Transcript_27215:298-1011(-)